MDMFQNHTQSASPTGEQLKEKGIKKVSSNNALWLDAAIARLKSFTQNFVGQEFPADFIRLNIPFISEPSHPNAWGALFKRAMREGILKDTGKAQKSMNPSAHSRKVTIYQIL